MSPRDAGEYAVSGWSATGEAAITAWGEDARAALEAGLQAVLALLAAPEHDADDTRSAPLHADGSDLAAVFSTLGEQLLEERAYFGGGAQDVSVDGVLRRDDRFIVWGYVSGQPGPESAVDAVEIDEVAVTADEGGRVALRATLRRQRGIGRPMR